MKRFLVFRCEHYYPSGGWDDLAASFETLDEAYKYLEDHPKSRNEDVRIVDLGKMKKL